MDAEFGLVYLRVPTWCPFRLQFYCNGHSWLACQLTDAGIDFAMADNAFVRIADWHRAQTLADALSPKDLHRVLDGYAAQCCPVLDVIGQSYHHTARRGRQDRQKHQFLPHHRTNGCCALFSGPPSISPAFAAPTFFLSSTSSLPRRYRATSPACVPSA
jgi:hypothetical protein